MVEYMRKFLEPFREPPYKVESIGGNQLRITNTFSDFFAIVRGRRGDVFEYEPSEYDENAVPSDWRWRTVSSERLIESLGIREVRGGVTMFISAEHKEFYLNTPAMAKKDDCYHRAFFYTMGLVDETRRHIEDLFDFKDDSIIPEGLQKAWQTGGSIRVCRMAFNLWGGYIEEGAEGETTPESLFACPFAPYFVEGLKLRFPESFAGGDSHVE